jgi:hypothetical protein
VWNIWRANDPDTLSRLYARDLANKEATDLPDTLLACYGEFGGGFLIGTSLKMATIDGRDVYGLYTIEELAAQPEVQRVTDVRPNLRFFLDAANVWYYGIEGDSLVAFDAELGELTQLGQLGPALAGLLSEWADA